MDKAELLKVLDMSETKQYQWCLYNAGLNGNYESVAGLAFRLRDEADADGNLIQGLREVHEYCDRGVDRIYSHTIRGTMSWFVRIAKPIHWIISALIAKGEQDG